MISFFFLLQTQRRRVKSSVFPHSMLSSAECRHSMTFPLLRWAWGEALSQRFGFSLTFQSLVFHLSFLYDGDDHAAGVKICKSAEHKTSAQAEKKSKKFQHRCHCQLHCDTYTGCKSVMGRRARRERGKLRKSHVVVSSLNREKSLSNSLSCASGNET